MSGKYLVLMLMLDVTSSVSVFSVRNAKLQKSVRYLFGRTLAFVRNGAKRQLGRLGSIGFDGLLALESKSD